MHNHFFAAVEARATPAAPFLQAPQSSAAAAWTYADMLARSAQMANALVALGVAPGDRVAAQIEKSPEGLMLYLGAIRAGAVFLPLNTAYTTGELDYFLRDAEPTVFVCDPARHKAIAALAKDCGVAAAETLGPDGRGSLYDLAQTQPDTVAEVPRAPDDLAAILYTSGTTGRSKGAMLTHANLVSNAEALVEIWRFTAADRLLHALPVYHTHGLFVATNVVLFSGASMLFLPKFDAGEIISEMPGATTMMGVPTFYTRLLDRPDFTTETARTIRLFTSGSAPLLAETHRDWFARTGHAILERYGMTETNMSTSNPYKGDRRAGTVGFPLPGVALRVVDPETGVSVAAGAIGMLEVKGPNVFKGYWRNPEKTAAEFRPDGFFITGDLCQVDPDGYLHIVGRGKDLIITGGFNVYPKELELEIDAISGVLESAVIGLPHKDFGEGVAAVVVLQPGAGLDETAVQGALHGRLAKFKLPKRVFFLSELPRNAMGKVQKNALRDQYKATFAG
ncbi:malonyl-CoA synthase [Beijerinckia sp. L45]|uniref:malonate--CoA ligase n=1 Tax=Beijerinckia sp. L45 TaxID=1641855 RepID=UPI00131D6726|nr:malonyl-CoA synthase [Beijerinckia sp. L45]